MEIEVLGADSMGVRSLATYVTTTSSRILIDPGVSVCPRRDRLPPHRLELDALGRVRGAIQDRAQRADAVVITHFHHDHYSSFEDRPLDRTDARAARAVYRDIPVYVKDWRCNLNRAQKMRALDFVRTLGRDVTIADARSFEGISFSPAVKHGEAGSRQGWVVMVRIDDGRDRFVFASDTQLIESEAVDWILDQRPATVVASGPPIYLRVLTEENRHKAHLNLRRLAGTIPTLIVDHHLLRTEAYGDFLEDARAEADRRGHRILTAAEFMMRPNELLEARRKQLWEG